MTAIISDRAFEYAYNDYKKQGLTVEEIAEKFGMTPFGVMNKYMLIQETKRINNTLDDILAKNGVIYGWQFDNVILGKDPYVQDGYYTDEEQYCGWIDFKDPRDENGCIKFDFDIDMPN